MEKDTLLLIPAESPSMSLNSLLEIIFVSKLIPKQEEEHLVHLMTQSDYEKNHNYLIIQNNCI